MKTQMLNYFFKLLNGNKVALFKATFLSFFIFFSSLSFGKDCYNGDSDVKNEKPTKVFVADGTTLCNAEIICNAEILIEEDHTKNEIFVFEGTIVYNNLTHNNIKITKLQNPDRDHNNKKNSSLSDKKIVAKKIIAIIKHSTSSQFYYNKPFNSSSFFSQNIKENLFLLQPTSQVSLTAINNLNYDRQSVLTQASMLRLLYENPSITLSFFSGKHSVRPPTYFS